MVSTTSDQLPQLLTAYAAWLNRQPLAANTRRAYKGRVSQYCKYLATIVADDEAPLHSPQARDYAVRDYKSYLKTVDRVSPRSVNLTLAAIDNFYRFLGLDSPHVRREDLPQEAPLALELAQQKRFLRAVERCDSVRDKALALLLFYTGLRLGECAALDVDDIPISARKGKVIVRTGKGDTYREIPLNTEVREAISAWLIERTIQFPHVQESALFLSREGHRLSTRAIDLRLRHLAQDSGLNLSAHTLRHTCITNLVRNGNDLVLVAEIAGHKRLETTRRYSLPTAQDREAAMESLRVDY